MDLSIAFLFITVLIGFVPQNEGIHDQQTVKQNQLPLFSFGIVADVQYADSDPAGTRFYRSSLKKLREAINAFKADSVDFVFNLGDLIDNNYLSYKPVLEIIDSSGLKILHVTGNHDYAVEPRMKKKIPQQQQSKDGYYSFVHNTFRFIILNGNEISTYSTTNKSTISEAEKMISAIKDSSGINAMSWNGGISNKQIEWLDNQLNESSLANEKVFLICHFPVEPENSHNLLNYKKALSVLEKYHNVIAWLNGHNHAGNYGNFNLTHFVTFKGMVETESQNSFAIIDVYKNKIWIRGYGREKSLILAY